MDPKLTLARLRKQRERTVDVAPGKVVTFLRPSENDMADMLKRVDDTKFTWKVELEHVRKYVIGWKGITEADLLGASVGAADEVPFDSELWIEVCSDDMAWLGAVSEAILTSVIEHFEKKDAARKNLSPG